jgi:hypothetical protein
MKFTFKTEKSTGRYRGFFSDTHHIKLNKVKCGNIGDDKPFKIRLQVVKQDIMEDGNKNCSWKWITLKKESETLEEAKKFLNDNFEAINKKFTIYIDKQ